MARQQRLADRAEGHEDGDYGDQQDRRRELLLVVERDSVVGFADLQAAVVVRADAAWQCGVDDLMDRPNHTGAHFVNPVFV